MPYTAITRADLRTRLTQFLEGKPFWTATEANAAINESLRAWNFLTGRWQTRLVLETTPGMREVALPTSIVYQTRLTWNGRPMEPTSVFDLDQGRRAWRIEGSGDDGVPDRPLFWAPESLQLLYLWPADTPGHNSLVIDGTAATPVLLTDGAFVDLSEADISCLLGYAFHVLSFKKGGQWFANSLRYYRAFLEHAAEENDLLSTSQVYRRYMGLVYRDEERQKGAGSSLADVIPTAPTGG